MKFQFAFSEIYYADMIEYFAFTDVSNADVNEYFGFTYVRYAVIINEFTISTESFHTNSKKQTLTDYCNPSGLM